MSAFFLAFLSTLLVTAAGREAVRAARLAQALGGGWAILLAGFVASLVAASLAAWLGGVMAPMLAPAAKLLMASIALGLGAAEIGLRGAGRTPKEPTRSLGAMTLALLAGLLAGSLGFLVLAMTLVTGDGALAAAGGTCGGTVALAVAILAAEDWERLPLTLIRSATAVLMTLAALVIGLRAFGIV